MFTDKIKELEATKAKVADLEKTIATERQKELGGLPAKYGFDSMLSFIKALKTAGGGRRKGNAAKGGGKKRKRAVITEATRTSVKKLVEAKKSGGEIATALGISLPSVQNIKKALGLVKARK